ncbi:MAG: septum formation inhibitor Maf [Gammaproteobacteria bacterium]|nr:MAG: septum formation inhibitor Maf [Gammaproteobacteria bacterium]
MNIFLASGSERRIALLKQIGIEPVAKSMDIDETVFNDEKPLDYVLRMAEKKAEAGRKYCHKDNKLRNYNVIGADTSVITCSGEILGKPHNLSDAEQMLKKLSGNSHKVITSVAVITADKELFSDYAETEVTMKTLNDAEISKYTASGEPFGKAGAYAIQGIAAKYISNINGSYSGVMGLPLFQLSELLQSVKESAEKI